MDVFLAFSTNLSSGTIELEYIKCLTQQTDSAVRCRVIGVTRFCNKISVKVFSQMPYLFREVKIILLAPLVNMAIGSSNFGNQDYIRLAVEDFNSRQSINRAEFKDLERWVVENKLDKINSRQKMGYCYFSGASVHSSPELSDARITWAKASFLVIILDDFVDVEGSVDELENLIQCVEKWNVNVNTDCCSEEVKIMFLAIKDVVSWIGDAAYKWQERDVTSHVIQCWLKLLYSFLKETKWARYGVVPTTNEYIENGYESFTLGTFVLSSLYFIGPKLSDDVVQSSEYHNLYELMSTHGRLINDIRTFKVDVITRSACKDITMLLLY
ncbi:putative ent-kaurene synthase [Helianthus annuus]|nr:putative ent-kaurene synthase [Helianthus annuus]